MHEMVGRASRPPSSSCDERSQCLVRLINKSSRKKEHLFKGGLDDVAPGVERDNLGGVEPARLGEDVERGLSVGV